MDVSKLIADLAAQGVASFKGYGIEIEFHRHREQATPTVLPEINSHNPVIAQLKKEVQTEAPLADAGLAQSMDAELPYDKVLNWSASPDPSEAPTPLTGDSVPATNEQA